MQNITNIPVYRDMYNIHLYIEKLLWCFPKKHYYTIGRWIRKLNLKAINKIYEAAVTSCIKKKNKLLGKAIKSLRDMKFYLTLSLDYKILSLKQCSYIFYHLEYINKQLVLWRGKSD